MKRAFTLIELMVAIAIMLLLMLGINYIFGAVSKASSATQAMSEMSRSGQGAVATIVRDLTTINADGPTLLLRSRAIPAFRNRADAIGDADGAPLTRDVFGFQPDEIFSYTYNDRNHRADIFSFFGRDLYRRGTGGGTITPGGSDYQLLVADMATTEGWIWYGHLALPGHDGTYRNPGEGTLQTNPDNFTASSWVLGRMAVLLQNPTGSPPRISTSYGSGQMHHDYVSRPTGAAITSLWPLAFNAPATRPSGTVMRDGRYDLAGTNTSQFEQIVKNAIAAGGPNFDWWSQMMLADRFRANAFVAKPINAESYSKLNPVFLSGCTQFIVEYAGDFLKQNATTGAIEDTYYNTTTNTDLPTDNEIDYILDGGIKRIRWYGLPRDVNDDGVIRAADDVVPLRDLWQTVGREAAQHAPFERLVTTIPKRTDYGTVATAGTYYTCAWGPLDHRPKLIRITFMLDTATGASEPQAFSVVHRIQ